MIFKSSRGYALPVTLMSVLKPAFEAHGRLIRDKSTLAPRYALDLCLPEDDGKMGRCTQGDLLRLLTLRGVVDGNS